MNPPKLKRHWTHAFGFHGRCHPAACETAARMCNEEISKLMVERYCEQQITVQSRFERAIFFGQHNDEFGPFPCLGETCVVCLSGIEDDVISRDLGLYEPLEYGPEHGITDLAPYFPNLAGKSMATVIYQEEIHRSEYEGKWNWCNDPRCAMRGQHIAGGTTCIGPDGFALTPEAPRGKAPEDEISETSEIHQNETTETREGE